MNPDARDNLAFAQPHMCPGDTGVNRFVDTVALHNVAAELPFSCAHPYDVCIRFGDRDGTHRRTANLGIGHGPPRYAAVGCLPQSAAGSAKEVFKGSLTMTGYRDRPSTPVGADVAPSNPGEELRVRHKGWLLLDDGRLDGQTNCRRRLGRR